MKNTTRSGRIVDFVSDNFEAVNLSSKDYTVDDEQEYVGVYVGTGGNLKVRPVGRSGGGVIFTNIQDGTFLPILVNKIYKSSTASNIVALL